MSSVRFICASVVHDTLHNGSVNFGNLIQDLNTLYGGTNGYVFLADRTVGEKLSCAYSTDRRKYVNGTAYNAEDLPSNQFLIFHRVDLNAIVCFDGQPTFEQMATEDEQAHLHDCISLGIIMCQRKQWTRLEVSVCQNVAEKVKTLVDVVNKWCRPVGLSENAVQKHNHSLPALKQEVSEVVASAMTMLYDLSDYVELDTNTLELSPEKIPMEQLVGRLARVSGVRIVTSETLPTTADVDAQRLIQAVLGVTRRFRTIVEQVTLAMDGSKRNLKVYVQTSSPLLPRLTSDHLSTPGLGISLTKMLCGVMGGSFNVDKEGSGAQLMFPISS